MNARLNTTAKVFAVTSCIFLLSTGYLYSELKKTQTSLAENQADATFKDKVFESVNADLNNCINDTAALTSEIVQDYSFENFGLYSETFKGKSLTRNTYRYKMGEIEEMVMRFDSGVSISVWRLRIPFNYEGLDQYSRLGAEHVNFPIFTGFYEARGIYPTWIGDRLPAADVPADYTTREGFKMMLREHYAPKTIASLSYEFYVPHTALGKPIYVILSAPVDSYPSARIGDPSYLKAQSILEDFAETLSVRAE